MASQKESAPGADGISYSFDRCAGGLGSQIMFFTYEHVLEVVLFLRWMILPQVLRYRRLWNNCEITGRLTTVDSVQLRLQETHHDILSRPSLVHHEMHTPSQRSISSRQVSRDHCPRPCCVCSARVWYFVRRFCCRIP